MQNLHKKNLGLIKISRRIIQKKVRPNFNKALDCKNEYYYGKISQNEC